MAGELLRDGRYQIVGTLGEGAQGTTFDAIDRKLGQPVAIKRFAVKGARSWKEVELAEREAAVLEGLSHPALPAHVEHFEEDGALYLVMQKIEGQSLATLTARGGSISQGEVLRFLRDASAVLDYLHGRAPPVIHRDVNPKNVIRRPDGSHVLVDFGAVRDRLKPEGGSTVVGTFGYMAPEQFQGRALPASDVYAVGATALRLLTGQEPEKLPHQGLGIDVGAALGTLGSPALREALERMLEPDPDRRAARIAPLLDAVDAERAPGPSGRRSSRQEREDDHDWRGEPVAGDDHDDWRSSRQRRRDAREQWREARRRRRGHRRGHRRIGFPPLAVAVVGLEIAGLVVGLVLGVLVPLVLTLLSIVLGPSLRTAARRVQAAGRDARLQMAAARRALLGGGTPPGARVRIGDDAAEEPSDPATAGEAERAGRVRVEAADGDVIDTTGTAADDAEGHDEARPPGRSVR